MYSQSTPSTIKKHLEVLTRSTEYRNHENIEALNAIAEYIHSEFEKYCDTVYYQSYTVKGREYKNVVGVLGSQFSKKLIIGAHYDVCGNQEGADDNASGVTGILELARLLKKDTLNFQIEFVAYTLEEPPYFGTKNMGSYVHAESVQKDKKNILGMICLEMIGYFSDKTGSQEYPVKEMKALYGTKGDFVAVVQKMPQDKFCKDFASAMEQQEHVKSISIVAPESVTGVDFSDHANYWKFNIPAIMITNTAFYRNKNYHTEGDILETLNLDKMSAVINEVRESIKAIKVY